MSKEQSLSLGQIAETIGYACKAFDDIPIMKEATHQKALKRVVENLGKEFRVSYNSRVPELRYQFNGPFAGEKFLNILPFTGGILITLVRKEDREKFARQMVTNDRNVTQVARFVIDDETIKIPEEAFFIQRLEPLADVLVQFLIQIREKQDKHDDEAKLLKSGIKS